MTRSNETVARRFVTSSNHQRIARYEINILLKYGELIHSSMRLRWVKQAEIFHSCFLNNFLTFPFVACVAGNAW